MTVLGKNTIVEPQVDLVDPDCVVTNCSKFYAMDLNICTEQDCKFANTYKLQMTKDSRVDALLVWFDVGFDKGLDHKQAFSTSPFMPPTHWK